MRRLLKKLSAQRTEALFTVSCVVVDNDAAASAHAVVEETQREGVLSIRYEVEPERNFAVIRNRAVSLADGNLLAFIDDDEVPQEDWLLQLFSTLQKFDADGVLAPVRPYFDGEPPSWIVKGRICDRPAHPTGMLLHWRQTRTGNVLLKREITAEQGIRFNPAFRTGGEDVDFFRRAIAAGNKFVWCEEAPAFELVPQERLQKRYHLKRALLQGRISLKYAAERPSFVSRLGVAAKSFCAVAAYTLALPITFIIGVHHGMKYLIKDCHHLGRLMALVGIEPFKERNF